MNNIFSTDGFIYKFSMIIYRLLLLNLLWFLFSLPIITTGASTTALFYITGKIIRGETQSSIPLEFWKSYKMNFKQANIIFMIFLIAFLILFTNITNIRVFGSFAILLYPLSLLLLIHFFIVFIFSFPILARYHLRIKDCIKLSLYFAYQNIITTLLCLTVVPGLFILLSWNGGFYILVVSIYSFWISFFINDKVDQLQGIDSQE